MTATVRLDRVATVRARIGWKALTADEYVDEGYAFLSTPNIKSENIDFANVNYITEHRYDESPDLKLRVGDVLLAKDGSTLGVCNVVRSLPEPATVNGSIAVIRPGASVDGVYLRYVLGGSPIQAHIGLMKNGMGVPHLFQWDINRFMVPLPTLDEQRRIANFLDDQVARIDEVIRLREQQIAALSDWLRQRLRSLTTGESTRDRSRPTGVHWMPTVAADWGTPKVSHVFRTGSGTTPASKNPAYFDGDIPWVLTGDVRDGPIRETSRSVSALAFADYSALKMFPKGSLVVAMYGQGSTKGRVGLLEVPAAVNQACCVLTERASLSTRWAYHWFRGFKDEIVQLAVGSGQPNLSQDILRSLRIPQPSERAMWQLIEQLDGATVDTDLVQAEMRAQIDLLKERKASLITAAVTGEVDVTTANEVA